MILAYIDIGHGDKGTGRDYDPGAVAVVDGVQVTERAQAEVYAAELRAALAGRGIEVIEVPQGRGYAARHAWVLSDHEARGGAAVQAVYLQAHLNAGPAHTAQYGAVLYDARSTRGARLAAAIAGRLGDLHRSASRRTVPVRPGERGHSCVDGIFRGPASICGVVVEPYFIDGPGSAELIRAHRAVGEVIADGVARYVAGLP